MSHPHRQLRKLIDSRDRLGGRYRIDTQVGAGAYGMIFAAIDEEADRKVAVKAIPPHARERSETAIARFQREMKVIRNLQHRNIVSLLDWGTTEEGVVFMVLEFIDGQTLDEVVRGDPMDETVAVSTIRQLTSALEAAHRGGVIHRDLKPANVMLTEGAESKWAVKVLDFGMAKLLAPLDDESIADLTREGMAVGTPRYIAPEQARGKPVGPPADLYALGLLMYEMLTGARAVKADTVETAIAAHVSAEPLELDEIDAVPERMRSLLFRLIEKDPDRRLQSAAGLAELLAEPPDRWRSVLDDTQNMQIGPALGDVTGDFPGAGGGGQLEQKETRELVETANRSRSQPDGVGPGSAGLQGAESLELAGQTAAPRLDESPRRRQPGRHRQTVEKSRQKGRWHRWFRPPRKTSEWFELGLSFALIPLAFLAVGAQASHWGYAVRMGWSLLAPTAAVVWAISRSSGEWRKSFGRRCWMCCGAAVVVAHLLGPEELARELVRNPGWFVQPLQGVPGAEILVSMATWCSQHWAQLLFELTAAA